MRITIVHGPFFPVPPMRGGGLEKTWHALGDQFARSGHQVVQISREYGELPADEQGNGVRHLRVKSYDAVSSLALLKGYDFLYTWRARRILPPADILVTNTFWAPILFRDQSRGAVYVHVGRYPKGQMGFYRHARRLQTLSNAVRNAIVRQTPSMAPRTKVIPLPVIESHPFNPSNGSGREREVLFCGRLHPEKGVHLLIKAFSRLPQAQNGDWRLLLVGPWEAKDGGGGRNYQKELQQIARAKLPSEAVEFVGPVFDTRELGKYYRRAGIFVYPSLANYGEAFGLAPLEAMSQGCAPVVSGLECFQDFIQGGRNGLVFDHNSPRATEELADALRHLIENETERRRISEAALATAREYSVPKVAEQFLDDFESLLK